jgi:hypothetical protein
MIKSTLPERDRSLSATPKYDPEPGTIARRAALRFLVLILCSGPAFSQGTGSVEITLQRLSADRWQASWQFEEPVNALRVFPPQLSFRRESWTIESEGFSIEERDDGAVISRAGAPFSSLAVRFGLYSDFDPKTYVPVLPFSDGGAAVYSGHFSGDVLIGDEWQSIETQFQLRGLQAEGVLLPPWTSEQLPAYLYFGTQQPIEAEQIILIADQDMPQWLIDTFEQSVPVVTKLFSEKLDFRLEAKPLVLVAAGELEDFEGYSVKGAGLHGQFTLQLRGRDLLTPSNERRAMFQKMVAHEIFHVWQRAMPGGDFNPGQPWLHEGSADALAVAALQAASVWNMEQVESFHSQQVENCRASLGTSTLREAADSGNWNAIYACGYLEFADDVEDVFSLWARLVNAAAKSASPYTQSMLEWVRDQSTGEKAVVDPITELP